jgi:hypothetical protein
MTIVSVAGFVARFPEFTNVDEAIVQVALDDAICDITLNVFKECVRERAVYTLAAHYLSLSMRLVAKHGTGNTSDVVGSFTGKTVDKVSATYNSSVQKGSGDIYWNSTPYGVLFQELCRRYVAGMVSLNGN